MRYWRRRAGKGLLRRAGLRAVLVVNVADEVNEVERLQGIIRSLADRCAAQSELLARQAERRGMNDEQATRDPRAARCAGEVRQARAFGVRRSGDGLSWVLGVRQLGPPRRAAPTGYAICCRGRPPWRPESYGTQSHSETACMQAGEFTIRSKDSGQV